jgi:arylsulfatase A-like enzyme
MFRIPCFPLLLALLVACAAFPTRAAETQHPNIILILTDDMGYGDPTCYGGVGVPTPNIDSIAREGIRFTQYYSGAPVCSPSRAAILSGQFPGRHGLNTYLQTREGNRNADQRDFLDPQAAVFPRVLKSAGYATAHFGKWHMGGGRDVNDAPSIGKYGFDEWASTWESPEPEPALGVKYAPWDERLEPGQVPRYKRTEYMVNRTLDFLKRHKETPCYVNLWPDDVHTPHRPSPEMAAKYGVGADPEKTPRKSFLGVLDEYDRQIGRLLQGLKDLGIEKDTIVIFTSDNGPAPHLEHTRTAGLRGMKLSLYEGGTRMPFLVRWPGHTPAGSLDESSVVTAVDLPLTLCHMAGVSAPSETAKQSDGEDMSAALLGKPTKRTKPIFWEYGRTETAHGYPKGADRSPNLAVRDGVMKLLVNDNGTSRELYNIPADAKETGSIEAANAAVADDLARRAIAWRKTLPGVPHSDGTTQTKQQALKRRARAAAKQDKGSSDPQ